MNRAVFLVLSMLFVAEGVSAQESIDLKKPAARSAIDQFAECVVRRHHDAARDFVLGNDNASTNSKESIYEPICLDVDSNLTDGTVTLRAPTQEIRFALAEALIPRDLRGFDPKQITLTPAPRADLKNLQGLNDRDKAYVLLDAYSECVVRKDPSGVRGLLNTRLNGADEEQAVQALMPTLGACLDRGKQFGTDRSTLRGSLALAYYRLASAPKQPHGEPAQ